MKVDIAGPQARETVGFPDGAALFGMSGVRQFAGTLQPVRGAGFTGFQCADLGHWGREWQQVATGSGASNQSNTAQVNGSAFTAIEQSNSNVAVNFHPWW
ncbi:MULTISPECIES: hypothetical protein [unclassified Streptomyces]|uniref:hypothetical protein n=1 Tax=unclassified Streptomyces TaxID=2593676 RepID=UPI001BEBD96E|nr:MULTISPECIES: hypothetical protein [unclassified Streptomyces]MBT2402845.1 hypothetical protein [Streptomyces sp. ISL-21]MBT2454011.1 hypothetical protein [Streptomyces sp. ISL-86]MBT2607196.1 hypothetical protein [Streptomyces sp. ISL-87]